MATIKSFTSLEQSKILAKILPLESADMYYEPAAGFCTEPSEVRVGDIKYAHPRSIGCWSLAALLSIIRKFIGYTLQTTYNKDPKVFIVCELGDKPYTIESLEYDNEVDACVAMIENLHKLNLL